MTRLPAFAERVRHFGRVPEAPQRARFRVKDLHRAVR